MPIAMVENVNSAIQTPTKLNELLKNVGLTRRLPINPALNDLKAADFAAAQESIRVFEKVLATCETESIDPWKTENLMSMTFSELGLKYSDDFTSTLGEGDVVEGYSFDNLQIFRNLRFMEICGYDIFDILTTDWMTLFERSQKITTAILERCETVMTTGQTISLEDLPVHYMKERMSLQKQVNKVKFRSLGPIFAKAGTPAGVLVACHAEIIDESPERHELRFI